MKRYFSFLFTFFLFASIPSTASPAFSARAQWLDAGRLLLKLAPGLIPDASQLQFSLVDSSQMLRQDGALALPLLVSNKDYVTLDTSRLSLAEIEYLITRPLKVITSDRNQNLLDATAIQYASLLDQAFFYPEADLGANCSPSECTLKLWAPTAQNVRVHLLKDSQVPLTEAEIFDCQRETQGVWALRLPTSRKNFYYLYEVELYQPLTDKIEKQLVTDPYSKSLSLNGQRSQLVDLTSPESTPAGWNHVVKPNLNSLAEAVIYELHLRDFSAKDPTVEPALRGTFLAFSQDSQGTRHLRDLAQAGLTHLHLLPFNDFGSVNETKSHWRELNLTPPFALPIPQELLAPIREQDSYNWGYDPVHYFTPEGSYATHGDGISRIKETRTMIQAINHLGLRVIQDVVFNHTYKNGLGPFSVFDKIVPLYYYRTDENGKAFSSSCCPDTASEHRMMEKLMVESILFWAKNYKIDGFRFDLMSFHSRSTILKIRDALRDLTLADDGVDGSKILLYGEGWTFGSFYDAHPDESMTHENSFGSGIGFFNDRLRDAARGGTTNSHEKSDQGFATGLFFDFNQEPANRNTPVDLSAQREKLLHLGDVLKVGLAGNLRDLSFRDHLGNTITGYGLKFRNEPVAYGATAQENINYVSSHDGYGVWDAIEAKAPFYTQGRSPQTATPEDRQRIQQLLMAIPLLGQGMPFVEAGTELLRSKNGDQDSYNSGDFFNQLDWSGQANTWGAALPPAWKNLNDWPFWEPRLKAPELHATPQLIGRTKEYFKALLRVRRSSKLFSLNTPREIAAKLRFIDNDSKVEPGLIALLLESNKENILIFFNASRESRIFNHEVIKRHWTLHPHFDERVDPVLGDVSVNPSLGSIHLPGRTTVILRTKEFRSKAR